MMAPQDSEDEQQHAANTNQKPKGRFMVSPAAPEREHSADEDADGKSDLSSPGFEDTSPPQPSSTQQKQKQINGQISPESKEWIAPDTDKSTWTQEQCSQWVTSLGKAYEYVGPLFIDNGVDGELLSDEELSDPKQLEDMLKEIVTNKL